LYEYASLNIIKKIESSEMTIKNLRYFKKAIDRLLFVKRTAVIHMGTVEDAATLVIIADFFMKMAEATGCIVSGTHDQKLIVIFRNAGFRRNAGKVAKEMFGDIGSAGGHKSMARAEIPLEQIRASVKKAKDLEQFVIKKFKRIGKIR
jgi:nanoRNase/pAp phosphatase (c-di-AMP/oligoRNAs hydrolase)